MHLVTLLYFADKYIAAILNDSVQCIYIHIQEDCGSGTVMVVIAHLFPVL